MGMDFWADPSWGLIRRVGRCERNPIAGGLGEARMVRNPAEGEGWQGFSSGGACLPCVGHYGALRMAAHSRLFGARTLRHSLAMGFVRGGARTAEGWLLVNCGAWNSS